MKLYISLLILTSMCLRVHAQQTAISGTISGDGHTLPAATVSLLRAADSSWVRSDIADDSGHYTFRDVAAGSYMVAATYAGYATVQKPANVTAGNTACDIVLQRQDSSLGTVIIAARKPFMEVSLGKLTVNIEGSATTAGENALDLLRRLPGVTVSPNGDITMHGKAGVLLLIDDRPTYLSGEDLAGYLRGIIATDIAQTEQMTQPPARYDAEGNNGVINIKLKKNRRQGINGTASLMYGQTVYEHREESLSLSYRKDKLDLSLNANDMSAGGFADVKQNEQYTDPATGAPIGSASFHSNPRETFSISSVRLAGDYDWSENTTVGANVRGSYHPNSTNGFIDNVSMMQGIATENTQASADNSLRRDVSSNVYLTHKYGKENRFDINADQLLYRHEAYEDLASNFLDAQGNTASAPTVLHTQRPIGISVYSARIDNSMMLDEHTHFDAGVKTSWVTTVNENTVHALTSNEWLYDTTRSNTFNYRENINAAYATLSHSFGTRWDTKVSLRAEQTNTHGLQEVNNTSFSRHYISLFPTAFIGYKINKDNQLELDYGRRIDRPGYRELNPFVWYNFFYHYNMGNPGLQPWYTHSLELKYSYKNMIVTGVNVSDTRNIECTIMSTDAAGNLFSIPINSGYQQYAEYNVMFNKELSKWLSVNASAYAWYSRYSSLVNGDVVNASGPGYSFNWSVQGAWGKGWKAETNGYYSGGSITSAVSSQGPQLYVGLGLSRTIGPWQLKAVAYDPANINLAYLNYFAPGYRSSAVFRYAVRMFGLTVSYTFGKSLSSIHQEHTVDEAGRIK